MREATLLRVGIDDAPPTPMQIGDPGSGTFRGCEVDLLGRLAERLDYALQYRQAKWSLITGELVSGKLDLICSAATVTEQRKAQVSFCKPYLKLRLALVVRENFPEEIVPAEIRYGVRRGTTAEEFLGSRLGIRPAAISESNEELYSALSNSELDAIIDDSPIAIHFVKCTAGLSYRGPYGGTDAEYAFMIAKDNDALRANLDAGVSALEAEGTLAELRERWFGSPALLVA